MASAGKSAYDKHFAPFLTTKGRDKVVETQIKPNTSLLAHYGIEVGVAAVFDVDNPDQQISGLRFPEYMCVLFIDENPISDFKKVKIRIMHTHGSLKAGTEYRVDIDRLIKPGAGAGAFSGRLKPQKVGLDESWYSYQAATDVIVDTIIEKGTIPATMKSYLLALFWYTCGFRGHKTSQFPGGVSTAELKKARAAIPDEVFTKWKSTIQNDFGEVLGPFALYSYTLMDNASYNTVVIPKTCRVWWPVRPNERLLDFGVKLKSNDDQTRMMRFSSKAGTGATNTVKSEDITGLLKEKKNKKWNTKPQYKIFQILTDNSPTNGPVLAVQYLMTQHRSLVNKYHWPGAAAVRQFKSDSTAANATTPYAHAKDWTAFAKNKAGKGSYWGRDGNPLYNAMGAGKKIKSVSQLTKENIRYACEVILRNQCVEGAAVSMNRIFADAIRGKVWYIKFKLGDDGVPSGLWQNTGWKIERDNDYATSGDVCFRTQNQLNSQKGKIGIDPKVSAEAVNY